MLKTNDLHDLVKQIRAIAQREDVRYDDVLATVFLGVLEDIHQAMRESMVNSRMMMEAYTDRVANVLAGGSADGADLMTTMELVDSHDEKINGLAGIVGAHAQALDNVLNTLQHHEERIAAIAPDSPH